MRFMHGPVSLRRPSSGSQSQSLGHLVLQRKRADCGIASPVIAALCGQNANRQSEQERGGDSDYALGHHGSPLGFEVTLHAIAAYSTAACDGRHEFGEYSAIVRNYCRMHLSVFYLRVSREQSMISPPDACVRQVMSGRTS